MENMMLYCSLEVNDVILIMPFHNTQKNHSKNKKIIKIIKIKWHT